MQVLDFDHVNLRTADSDRLAGWYDDILGLKPGWRPSFGFHGHWLYIGDKAILHLVETADLQPSASPAFEHVAFSATGLGSFIARLDAAGIDHRLAELPDAGVVQVNLHDCDGNHIHVDFPLSERSQEEGP